MTTDVGEFLDRCRAIARSKFGYDSLRSEQESCFRALAEQPHVLAVLPTGAGKTLLYSVAAYLWEPGPVLVVSPLVALMRDQVRRFDAHGVRAVHFSSDQSEEERRLALSLIAEGEARVVFISPERLAIPGFQEVLRRQRFALVAIDEAHCVAQWGHGFRPEYAQIGQVLNHLGIPRRLAVTATASKRTRAILREALFPEPEAVGEVVFPPLRTNIYIEGVRVYSEAERWVALDKILDETPARRTIIYFPTRKLCEEGAKHFTREDRRGVVYHAGLPGELRQGAERYVQNTQTRTVVCATLAYGMGVDLPDVGLVLVAGFTSSIEEFFQMCGRAGREGGPARAALIWNGSDPKRRLFQLESAFPTLETLRSFIESHAAHFPKRENERRFLDQHTFFTAPGARSTVEERERDGILQALRFLGAIHPIGYGDKLYSLEGQWDLDVLLAELPPTPTKRRIVLEAMQRAGTGKSDGAVFVARELQAVANENEAVIARVLRHYAESGKWRFTEVEPERLRNGLLLRRAAVALCSDLHRYLHYREGARESLNQLSAFVEARQCRLAPSASLFAPRRIAGATGFSVPLCGHCDLCVTRAVGRRGRTRPFERFARELSPS